ncbi:hypothetical protein RIF29_27131 [Crotalaria pallida]|uniref:Endonuclease V n=1 Tax=Crotalaria pallida TaxID=3830 RepID=A0AAN9EPG8_CROPI
MHLRPTAGRKLVSAIAPSVERSSVSDDIPEPRGWNTTTSMIRATKRLRQESKVAVEGRCQSKMYQQRCHHGVRQKYPLSPNHDVGSYIVGDSVVGSYRKRGFCGCAERATMEKPKLLSQTEESTSSQQHQAWITEQDVLREKLIMEDYFTWKLPTPEAAAGGGGGGGDGCKEKEEWLRYIGGVDISFSKDDSSMACGTLVVLDFNTLQVVYQDFSFVTLQIPYVPGFLAFREAPVLLEILEKMKRNGSPFYPQLLMVDGNGILHPRGFGLACHLGVVANLPTIGIGKNLHHVDGLNQSRVRELLGAKENSSKDFITLVGSSGHTWGAAMRSTQGSIKPIYISIGHRISLHTAIKIVQMTCTFRVPEPVRQADIRSRSYIRKLEVNARTM